MNKLIRSHGELYLVERDYGKHCSIYVYIDYLNSIDRLSFIFCDSINPARARKSIRLDCSAPVAVTPTHPIFEKKQFWNINNDGYDKVLLDILSRKNSMFPTHMNWERLRILYMKHSKNHHDPWWKNCYHEYGIPDYTKLWGIHNWSYLDNDPDMSCTVNINNQENMALRSSHVNGPGILVYDDCEWLKAKKVAKISIFKPEYLEYTPNEYACIKSLWRLNDEEKKKLTRLLQAGKQGVTKTNWEKALDKLIREISFDDSDKYGNKKIYPAIPLHLAMPDYTQLP